MAGKREKPEEIVSKLRQVEVLHDARMAGSVTLRRNIEVASERQLWAGGSRSQIVDSRTAIGTEQTSNQWPLSFRDKSYTAWQCQLRKCCTAAAEELPDSSFGVGSFLKTSNDFRQSQVPLDLILL